jgi:hypothetical protein
MVGTLAVIVVLNVLLLGAAAVLFRRAHLVSALGPRCRSCGYDLHVDAEQCSECGTLDPFDPRVTEGRTVRLQAVAVILILAALLLDLPFFVYFMAT